MSRRAVFAGLCLAALPTELVAQQCNPLIDGTYCASQTIRRSDTPARDANTPMIGIGRDLASTRDEAVTFGAITFRGDGTRCVGLMTRGNCK